jgi:hypothetical protein
MTRHYIRLDPAFDERKEAYPDGPYAALVAALCLAEAQPDRGRFRSADYLRRLLGKRGRHVPYLMAHGDLSELPDGRLYIDGWDEWQEGDWKVAERVQRIRNRPRNARRNGSGNASGNGDVTADRNSGALRSEAIQSGALTTDRSSVEKHGSKNLETDEERMARYLALRDDPSKSADIRYAAENEVKRLEALRLN